MSPLIRRSLIIAGSTLLTSWLTGCGAEPASQDDDAADDQDIGHVASAASTSTTPAVAQKKVHAAFSYVFGRSTALFSSSKVLGGGLNPVYPCNSDDAYQTKLNDLKDELDLLTAKFADGSAEIIATQKTVILGLPAVERSLVVTSCFAADINTPNCQQFGSGSLLRRVTDAMAACWGDSVRPFAYISSQFVNGREVAKFDPRPAKLTATLNATTGATAAAVFVADNTATTARYFTSSWAGSTIAAGTPCSTAPLPIGQETLTEIQAVGSLRRCY